MAVGRGICSWRRVDFDAGWCTAPEIDSLFAGQL